MPSTFFSEDTHHGHGKRILLKKYLQGFVPVSYSRTTERFGQLIDGFIVIDGFSGKGRYEEDWPMDIDRYGSPLISLMVVLNFYHTRVNRNRNDVVWDITRECVTSEMIYTENNESNILNERYLVPNSTASLFFVESKRNNFDSLVENVHTIYQFFFNGRFTKQKIGPRDFIFKDSNHMITCTVINCKFVDFSSNFPDRSFYRRACFTFVDPYGYSHSPMTAINKFVGDKNKTLLMNFMSRDVNRFVTKFPEKVANCYGYTLPERHTRKFGLKLMAKIREPQPDCPSYGNIRKCAVNFQRALIPEGTQDLSLMFEMRGEGNVPIYHLVFVTGHEKNYGLMKEAMNRCTQYELEFILSDYDILRKGFAMNLSNMQDNAIVAEAIFKRFRGHRVSIKSVERYILYETPFVFRKKALSAMEKESNPRIKKVKGGTRKRRYTYPDRYKWYLTFRH